MNFTNAKTWELSKEDIVAAVEFWLSSEQVTPSARLGIDDTVSIEFNFDLGSDGYEYDGTCSLEGCIATEESE